jgi:hypothetical protein
LLLLLLLLLLLHLEVIALDVVLRRIHCGVASSWPDVILKISE